MHLSEIIKLYSIKRQSYSMQIKNIEEVGGSQDRIQTVKTLSNCIANILILNYVTEGGGVKS